VTAAAWDGIMIGVAGLIVINGLMCLRLARLPLSEGQAVSPPKHPLANILEVMKDANITRFAILNGLYNFGQTNFFTFLTLFMREVAHASQPMASLAIGIAQGASAFARIGWGVVSDTVFSGRRKGLTVGLGAAAAAGLAAMVWVGPGPGVTLGLGLALVLGLTVASFAPLVQTMAVETTEPRLAGSSLGYNMLGTHIGGMIGPPVFGAIVDASGGYGAGWLATAAVMGAGTLLLAFGFKERER
jgi:predicted MFS family arabinose efflux permease